MHFLQHLLRWMLPIQVFEDQGNQEPPPPGFTRVIDHLGNYVVTNGNENVIAPL
jgi:hypothetical protein